MLLFQVKEFTSRSGDEIVLLLDRQDGPTFWPNVFVTSQYVVAGRAADTRKKVLRSIGMARMWAASLSRNLDDELSFGPFLSTQDVPSLADFLGLNAATQESRFAENRAIAESSGRARRLEDLRPDRRRLLGTQEKAAHPDEVGNRIRWVAEYVDWHLCRRLGDMQHSGQDAYALREHGLEVLSLLRQRIPSNSARHDEIALEGISEEAEAALEATLHPASDQMLGKNAETHADAAIQTALREGLINEIAPKHYQARAPGHMEREIERCVLDRLERSRPAVDRVMVATVIGEVEREDGIVLAPEQKEAVLTALSSGFSVITGGAGTGKSTVVKAIRRAHLRRGGGDYIQVALSGRAAKRLREATGANAMTIYRFIKDAELGKFSMTKGLLVVDEFSMVGTPDLWQLLTMSPPDFDVVLVGDSAQLPPIKAGNPASALIQAASIPKTTLRLAQRQAASTGIPDVAEAIREGSFPDLPTFDLAAAARPGVYLWNCPESDVPGAVIQAFEALVGVPARSKNPGLITRLHQMDVQILAMTRRGPAGAADLGDAIEHRWMASQEPVADWGFSVGSKLLWTQNSYDRPTGKLDSKGTEITIDIMNGALGVITNAIGKHAMARFDDGTETMLSRNDLARVLRGWAITVHKAQGSAFKTVLIPVVRSRLLDRAMLYTAVTRARLTAVLIGEDTLMRRVVGAPPGAWQRLQALDIDRAARRAGLAHNELNGSVNPRVAVRDAPPGGDQWGRGKQ